MRSPYVRTLIRSLIVWFAIISTETVNGIFRVLILTPSLGDQRGKQISFMAALVLMLLIATASISWIGAIGRRQLLLIGLLWAALTFCFEVFLGVFVMDAGWDRIVSEYDLANGGLMGLGLLYMVFLPMLAAGLRRKFRPE